MADKSWKAFERRVAAMLGTRRISAAANSQRHDWGRDAPDCMTDTYACQLKLGYRMPGYLTAWMKGIRETSEPLNRIGVLVWKPLGGLDKDAVVMLRLEDFVRVAASAPATDRVDSSPSHSSLELLETPSDSLP